MDDQGYYRSVADFYDHEACRYEERYWTNAVAQRIRQAFREEVKSHSFRNVLEIGCGTGLDVAHFASIYPDRTICGIDIAPAMVANAARKIADQGLTNARVMRGTPEDLGALFPTVRFDHIYVFFGALNTVPDLPRLAAVLRDRLNPGGTMVLTFVNKWYLTEMLISLLRFRFRRIFERGQKVWGGYSSVHRIESRCFSPREIRKSFADHFEITRRQGYSILYPAWYRTSWIGRFGRRLSQLLWDGDRVLNRTPAWGWGEYALYSFRAKG
ncbi:MAG TPA: class I SAM-dependent methyltransferase [Candidatus Didemnitutus sp.]|nr:class I SAM-dependent methyltransferase [Candidatus Didemnitutus sp.]